MYIGQRRPAGLVQARMHFSCLLRQAGKCHLLARQSLNILLPEVTTCSACAGAGSKHVSSTEHTFLFFFSMFTLFFKAGAQNWGKHPYPRTHLCSPPLLFFFICPSKAHHADKYLLTAKKPLHIPKPKPWTKRCMKRSLTCHRVCCFSLSWLLHPWGGTRASAGGVKFTSRRLTAEPHANKK